MPCLSIPPNTKIKTIKKIWLAGASPLLTNRQHNLVGDMVADKGDFFQNAKNCFVPRSYSWQTICGMEETKFERKSFFFFLCPNARTVVKLKSPSSVQCGFYFFLCMLYVQPIIT
jgi:hypothetical protein